MSGVYGVGKDGEPYLDPHPGQWLTWDSKRRYILMLAGAQSGKTTFGPWWLAREIRNTAQMWPGGENDYLAITTSFPLFSLKMLPALLEVFCDTMRWGKYWPSIRTIELRDPNKKFWAKRSTDRMWGRIVLMSINQAGGVVAITAKGAWLDELGQDEWDANDFRDIQLRLALNRGRVLGTTTPYNSGYIKSEWYDRWVDGDPEYDVIQFPSTMNPAFPKEEFDKAEQSLPDWRFLMFFKGQFARPSGLIISSFEDWMLVDPRGIPKEWPRRCGVDFGGANTAQIWLAEDITVDPTIWYAYDEYLGGGVSTKRHADRTIEHDEGLDVDYWGGAGSETQERRDWTANGVLMKEPPVGKVEVGISRVIQLMNEGRFRCFRTLKGLRHELATYRRKLDEAGLPIEEIADKRKFHRIDSLRYVVDGIFGPLDKPKKKARARSRL